MGIRKERILNTLTLSTGCPFYRVTEHGSCHGMSRRTQAFYEIKQPCQGHVNGALRFGISLDLLT